MAINIAYTATGTYVRNASISSANVPMITVHGTGGENVTRDANGNFVDGTVPDSRVRTLDEVLAAASGVNTTNRANPGVFISGRDVTFDRILLRITGNAFVDMSGYNVTFILDSGGTNGGLCVYGFNNTAPTTTDGDFNGQAGIFTNQCNLVWDNRHAGAATNDFNRGPFYSYSRWEGDDFNLLLDNATNTVSSNWLTVGRGVTMNTSTGVPTAVGNNRDDAQAQPIWTLNRGIITDGSGYSWGPQANSEADFVLNPASALNNLTINTARLQLTVGTFEGFASTAAISGFNRRNSPFAIYGGLNFINSSSLQSGQTWTSGVRDTPMEFRNYDFGPNWAATLADRFNITYAGIRGRQPANWYRWLYDWNIGFQEGSGDTSRLNGAPFDVFITRGNADGVAEDGTTVQRIGTSQLWAGTVLNSDGLPAWTPAASLANPTGSQTSLGNEPLELSGTPQTNIPIIKYWMNGLQPSASASRYKMYETTRYDAMLAWYPFDVIDYNNQTIEPRSTLARTPANAATLPSGTFNNPIPSVTQTASEHAGITEGTLTTVAAYNNLTNTGQVFDRAWYEYLNSIIEGATYAAKTTAMNNPAALVLNNDGDLVPGNSSITDITIDPVVPHSTTVSQAAVAGATSITLASVPGSIPSSGILYLRRVDGTFNTISYTGRNVTTGVISGIPATGFGSLRAAASVGDVITQPAIDVGTTSITIHTGANFQLNHNIRVTGTITRTGVAVDNNGFSLIDGNAPIVTVSNAPALMPTTVNSTGTGVVVQFFNYSGGTLVSNTPFHTITGDGTFDRSLSAFTSGITGIRAVASHPDFVSRVYDFPTLGTAPVDIDLALMQRATYPSDALSGSNIGYLSTDTGNRVYISAATLDAGNSRLTLSVDGNQLAMSDSQLNDWIHKAVKLRPEFGRLVAILGEDPIGSSGSTGFPISNSDNLRFTPGTTNNSTYNFGHLSNSSTAMGATPATFGVSRQLSIVGGGMSTIGVSFAESASAFDGAAVGVAIDQRGLATRADVESARDVVVGQI